MPDCCEFCQNKQPFINGPFTSSILHMTEMYALRETKNEINIPICQILDKNKFHLVCTQFVMCQI